jgi:hypothetical protein
MGHKLNDARSREASAEKSRYCGPVALTQDLLLFALSQYFNGLRSNSMLCMCACAVCPLMHMLGFMAWLHKYHVKQFMPRPGYYNLMLHLAKGLFQIYLDKRTSCCEAA